MSGIKSLAATAIMMLMLTAASFGPLHSKSRRKQHTLAEAPDR